MKVLTYEHQDEAVQIIVLETTAESMELNRICNHFLAGRDSARRGNVQRGGVVTPVHLIPEGGETFPCCGQSMLDRETWSVTLDPAAVTCNGLVDEDPE